MVKCEILFDNNPQGIYYSGQQVTGKVKITLYKKKDVQAIILNISGRAKIKLKDHNHTAEKNEVYVGKEQYLDKNIFLLGSPEGKRITLNAGIYTYNFACNLPLELPSSFEGKHGHIRYLAKVIIERPWKFDQEYIAAFTVLKEVDLNFEEPDKRAPFQVSTIKQLRSGFFNKQPFSIVMSLPHMGFVPGQVIPISINVKNESNTCGESLEINFKQIVTYKGHFQPKTQTFKFEKAKIDYLYMKNFGSIPGQSNKNIFKEIRIPSVPPSSKNSCSIISIDYTIEAKVYFGLFRSKIKISSPIIIGTVPLHSVEGGAVLNTSQNSNIANLEPPSYEEVAKMEMVTVSDEVEHPLEESYYLPRYPVYTFEDKVRGKDKDLYLM